MAPTITRAHSVIYGTHTVGGTSDTQLDGPVIVRPRYLSTDVEFTALVTGASLAAYATAAAAFTLAFRTPRQRLRIVLSSGTPWDWNPETNSGYLAEPMCELDTSRAQGGTFGFWRVRITVQTGAHLAGQNGLVAADAKIVFNPAGVTTLTVAGEYRAITNGVTGYAQFLASYAALVAVWTGILGGSWDLIVIESATPDDANKRCRFVVSTKELAMAESEDADNETLLVGQTLSISVDDLSEGDSSPAARSLLVCTAVYSTYVNKSEDEVADLKSIWDDKIVPHVVAQVQAACGTTAIGWRRGQPVYDLVERRISATLVFSALNSSALIRMRRTVRISWTPGLIVQPVASGHPYEADIGQGHDVMIRTTKRAWLRYGSSEALPAYQPRVLDQAAAAGGGGSPMGIFGFGEIAKNGFDTGGGGIFAMGTQLSISIGGSSGGGGGGGGAGAAVTAAAEDTNPTFVGLQLGSPDGDGVWMMVGASAQEDPVYDGRLPYRLLLLKGEDELVERWLKPRLAIASGTGTVERKLPPDPPVPGGRA